MKASRIGRRWALVRTHGAAGALEGHEDDVAFESLRDARLGVEDGREGVKAAEKAVEGLLAWWQGVAARERPAGAPSPLHEGRS